MFHFIIMISFQRKKDSIHNFAQHKKNQGQKMCVLYRYGWRQPLTRLRLLLRYMADLMNDRKRS